MSPIVSRRFVPDHAPAFFPVGLLALVLALLPAPGRAEADVFGLGNAQQGSLQVRDPGFVINTSTPLAADVPAGVTELSVVDASGFAAGQLVMVLQMGGEQPLSEYRDDKVKLGRSGEGAGRWELARLSEVATGVLRLTAPLVSPFSRASQVVLVPEYKDVRIQNTGSLRAPAWNGRSGGVLAFLATGTVFNQGSLEADGMGFQGGAAEAGVAGSSYDCAALDGPAGSGGASGGGARKGEGLASALSGAPTRGYGQLANGGGGGNCHDSGGGGGGHVGQGGRGARSSQETTERDVGGRGGAALRYEPLERLLLGGGGGAGIEGSAGGAGGGIIFVRAREIQGPKPRGFITANGLAAPSSVGMHGGGGGGGAGGTVHVRVAQSLGCTGLSAKGGAGADSDTAPGGGGGGGLLFVQSSGGVPPECTASAGSGLAGNSPQGTRGAEPVVDGASDFEGDQSVIDQGFVVPAVPSFVSPGAGADDVDPLPRFEGRTAPGASVQVFLDGAPLGAPVVADEAGNFVLVSPVELAKGPHEVHAWAELLRVRSVTSEALGFTVGEGLSLQVGFGCGVAPAGGAWGLGLGVLVLSLGARRRRE
ncbi:adventurous gliding motility protein AgmC [Archangium sp.]|uniref:adventurous gliding motility protein AgmC n=1 Tax=Archangium sp. TaxID=1872627 RepID=UPI00389A76BB